MSILAPTEDASELSTAAQLAAALSSVLGTADPSSDLEERIRSGGFDDELTSPFVPSEHSDARPEALSASAGLYRSQSNSMTSGREEPSEAGAGPWQGAAAPGAALTQHDDLWRTQEFDAMATDENLPESRRTLFTSRPVLWLIVALAVGTLVVSLIAVAANRAADDEAGPAVTSSQPPEQTPGEPLNIVDGVDFDPEADGGNAEENPSQVTQAFDGDPATGWSTVRYHNRPDLGGLKPGVGIVLDLGEARTISSVDLQFEEPGTSVELRVPAEAGAESAPMDTQSQWSVVASQADAGTSVTLTPGQPPTSRFVLVYLTNLPQVSEARYLSTITDVVVNG